MIVTSCFSHQGDVTFDLLPFTFGADTFVSVLRTIFARMNIAAIEQFVDFAVCGYHFVKLFDFFHSLTHHFVTLYTSSIIGKGTNMRCQCIKIRKSFAFFTIGDGTIRQDFDQSGFFDGFQLRCQCFGTIGHWIQVWHSANGGVTAVCCRLCTGTDGLFIKNPGSLRCV